MCSAHSRGPLGQGLILSSAPCIPASRAKLQEAGRRRGRAGVPAASAGWWECQEGTQACVETCPPSPPPRRPASWWGNMSDFPPVWLQAASWGPWLPAVLNQGTTAQRSPSQRPPTPPHAPVFQEHRTPQAATVPQLYWGQKRSPRWLRSARAALMCSCSSAAASSQSLKVARR